VFLGWRSYLFPFSPPFYEADAVRKRKLAFVAEGSSCPENDIRFPSAGTDEEVVDVVVAGWTTICRPEILRVLEVGRQ